MKKTTHYLSILILILFVNASFAKEITGQAAQQLIKGAEKIITSETSDIPNYIQFRTESQLEFAKFDAWSHRAFSLSANYGYTLLNTTPDQIGQTHYRYQQTFNGIPVQGTMYILHVKNNKIVSMNGDLFSHLNVSSSSSLNEATALTKALAYMHGTTYRWQSAQSEEQLKIQTNNPDATWYPKGELFLAPVNGNFSNSNFKLTYRFDIYSEVPLSRQYVFVDATSGEVIYNINRIETGNSNGTAITAYSGARAIITDSTSATNFRLREAPRGAGLGVRTLNLLQGTDNGAAVDFTDTDNNWNNINPNQDEYATDAHWGAEMTYDFYMQNFSRNSIDNAGMILYSYVHYSTNYTNAFWDGSVMTYGDGNAGNGYTPLTSLEITGHEISHGVTERTSNLNYANESGALNESFSDCMGNAIRYFGKQPGSIDWLIGNEIGGTPFRSMANPNAYQNPDCYNGLYWNAPNEVHNNSGVMNFWFYLLTEGGTGTNDIGSVYTVNALGIDKAQAICFRMNTVYLSANSNYANARTYAIQSAIDLYGACTNEVVETANAWYACGVGNMFTPGVTSDFAAPTVSFCQIPATVNFANNSSNAGVFTWDFGDGGTSTLTTPSHTYNAWGTYSISLIADGGSCGIDTLVRTLYISIDSLNACIISLPTTGTAQTQTGCTGFLYDSGGPTADYTDGTDARVTIAPTGASTVTLTFTSFAFENNYDFLYIYDGPTIASPQVPGSPFTGMALPGGGTITSTGSSITVRQTTDQGAQESGFALSWQCALSTVPPTAAFSADVLTSCSGDIQFTDHSLNGPTSWAWNFGDGNNSALQNPSHTYIASGIYTVTLTAANGFGSDLETQTNYITINLPAAPTGTGSAPTCSGDPQTLTATGSATLTWFSVPAGGTSVGTGGLFTTPPLTGTTTYYVESDIFPPAAFDTPHDSAQGSGTYYASAGTYRAQFFDCFSPSTLVSVKVYSNAAVTKTITLIQNSITLQTATVNIPAGVSRVTLNFPVPAGVGFELGTGDGTSLYRNNGGAVYPYTLAGVVSITGSSATVTGYYYFFYDWELVGPPCVSGRTPVVANVIPGPTANYTANLLANIGTFTDASTGAVTYSWNFGDPASGALNVSTLPSPMHTFTNVGIYNVCLTVTDAGGCSNALCQVITITQVGIADIINDANVSVFPNPVNDILSVNFSSAYAGKKWILKLTDIIGKTVAEKIIVNVQASSKYVWDLSAVAPGVYTLILQSDDKKVMKKIIRD